MQLESNVKRVQLESKKIKIFNKFCEEEEPVDNNPDDPESASTSKNYFRSNVVFNP